jgi:hypothetical protein
MDTVAVVYMRAGALDAAEKGAFRVLDRTEPGSHLWFRAHMHVAEIALARGNPEQARETLEMIFERSQGVPNSDILHANDLLTEAQYQLTEAQRRKTDRRPVLE